MAKSNTQTSAPVTFAALEPWLELNILSPEERKMPGKEWVQWGTRNRYPHYVASLAREVPTLRSVIIGATDYTAGDDVACADRAEMNRRGDTPRDIVRAVARNIWKLGGAYVLVTLDRTFSRISEVEVLASERIRTDEDQQGFWYSEKWDKSGTIDTVFYPRWVPGTQCAQSVLPIILWGEGAYPEPIYAAALKACETERAIADFHLSNIEKGFMGSYIVNFNNGIPSDAIKGEIERDFSDKFGGARNAGRIMFSWNTSKDAATTMQKMEVADYGEKYKTLCEYCRQQIFTSFRANPNLFGIPTEGNGFANEEYAESFKLYNRTQILPVQRAIVDAFAKLGIMLDIKPFSIEGGASVEG